MSAQEGKPDRPSRRAWLSACSHAALGTSAATLLWPLSRYVIPFHSQLDSETPSTLVLHSSELTPEHPLTTLYQGRPAVVLQLGDEPPRAFDAVCTHLGCTVLFDPQRKVLHCPCHGAEFDPATGSVLRGPATLSLSTIPLQVRNDTLVVGT